jgi:TetR/AcrR family transcriptional repressor of nem operon
MGVSKEKAVENRQAIITAAARLFRERGVDGVGLVELMKEAGFTPGGFYNHFKSKQALTHAVVEAAMEKAETQLATALAEPLAKDDQALLRQLRYYLSPGHRDDVEHGCSIAGLATDVARLGPETQAEFAKGLGQTFETFGTLLSELAPPPLPDQPPTAAERGMAYYSQLVGALILSRSVQEADPALSDALLAGVQRDILTALAARAVGPTVGSDPAF